MLSRTAENLFWMGRYAERADAYNRDFEADWWLEEEGLYADSMHSDGRLQLDGHWTQVLPVQLGLASPERARRVMVRLEAEFVNQWGLVHTRGADERGVEEVLEGFGHGTREQRRASLTHTTRSRGVRCCRELLHALPSMPANTIRRRAELHAARHQPFLEDVPLMLTTTNQTSQPLRRRSGLAHTALAAMAAIALTACGGGADDTIQADDAALQKAAKYSVGGTISGLGAEDTIALTLDFVTTDVFANGAFTLTQRLGKGSPYSVGFFPPEGYDCTIANGSGTIDKSNVTNVSINCVRQQPIVLKYAVSGLPAGETVSLNAFGFPLATVTADGDVALYDGDPFEYATHCTGVVVGMMKPPRAIGESERAAAILGEPPKAMVERHVAATGSVQGRRVLERWKELSPKLVKVLPHDYRRMLEAQRELRAKGLDQDEAELKAFEMNAHDEARVGGN